MGESNRKRDAATWLAERLTRRRVTSMEDCLLSTIAADAKCVGFDPSDIFQAAIALGVRRSDSSLGECWALPWPYAGDKQPDTSHDEGPSKVIAGPEKPVEMEASFADALAAAVFQVTSSKPEDFAAGIFNLGRLHNAIEAEEADASCEAGEGEPIEGGKIEAIDTPSIECPPAFKEFVSSIFEGKTGHSGTIAGPIDFVAETVAKIAERLKVDEPGPSPFASKGEITHLTGQITYLRDLSKKIQKEHRIEHDKLRRRIATLEAVRSIGEIHPRVGPIFGESDVPAVEVPAVEVHPGERAARAEAEAGGDIVRYATGRMSDEGTAYIASYRTHPTIDVAREEARRLKMPHVFAIRVVEWDR